MIDPKNAPRGDQSDTTTSPAPRKRRKAHPWAWIVGLIVALLLIWGFFGIDHLKLDVDSATAPAAAASVAD